MQVELLEMSRKNRLIAQSPSSILGRIRVRVLIGHLIRNSAIQLVRTNRSEKKYLNLGCGGNLLKDYINVDYGWSRGVDVCWDIKRGIPLKSGSLEGVFTEHMLEHFTWDEAIKLVLPECLRVLKPGGHIRISVPDAELCVETYQSAKAAGETDAPFRAAYDGGNEIPLTPMMQVNDTFRRLYDPLSFGHKFAYDFQTLEYFLHCVGFVDIAREAYMRGRDPMLLVDYKKRACESLYVEATKPPAVAVAR